MRFSIKLHFLVLAILFLLPLFASAIKADTLYFLNGVKITCEIKNLKLGKLTVKTVNMSTVNIKLEKVSMISSPFIFEIILDDRTKIYGTISKGPKQGQVILTYDKTELVVELLDIISIIPIKNNFFQRIYGSYDLGFSAVRSTRTVQLNSSLEVNYRTKKNMHTINSDIKLSKTDTFLFNNQNDSYAFTRYFKGNTFASPSIGWQKNTELGINNRLILILLYGFNPVQNNHNVMALSGGLVSNNEQSTSGDESSSIEVNLNAKYDLFIFSHPDIVLTAAAAFFPSLTEKNRYRLNTNFKLKYEIFNDFYLNITFYYNLDTRPPESSPSKYDLGVTIGISYSFGS